MAETADVVVIGLGAVGSAALYRLALAGARVVGIDRYRPPHTLGSSHGESRITRLAVGEGDAYAPLVRRSHEIWRELEDRTGETLMLQTGGLVMGPRNGAPHHGKDDFVRRTIRVARENGVAVEELDADGIVRRFPQFTLRGDELGCFEPTAGMLFPERCITTQLRLAAEEGAVIHLDEAVTAIRTVGDAAEVVTNKRTIHAARVILSAGAWLPGLAGGSVPDLVRIHRQTLHWFPAKHPEAFAPGRFPVFIWMHGGHEEDYFYGFPSLPGTGTVKIASERYAEVFDPECPDRQVSMSESEEIFSRHVSGRLVGLGPAATAAAACLYAVTPDSGFIVDTLPDQPAVLAASACSGHGFKHSSALGERLAFKVLQQGPSRSTCFSLNRSSLEQGFKP